MVVLYVLLPGPPHSSNICSYKRWQVVLGDFASSLLYGTFMALPLLVVGGTIEALTTWIGFTAIFWAMAGLGLCALWWSYFYSAYSIHLLDEAIVFASPAGVRCLNYRDIKTIEPVRMVPPRWLVTLSFLAALLGKGSARVGATGRSMILASSSSEGYCLGSHDGEGIYIWMTNSIGQNSLTNLDLVLKKLKACPASKISHIREFEAVFPPNIEPLSKARTKRTIAGSFAEPGGRDFNSSKSAASAGLNASGDYKEYGDS